MQLEQGFDLTPYAGMQVSATAMPSGTIRDIRIRCRQTCICAGMIIAGDILYYGDQGFVATLEFPEG